MNKDIMRSAGFGEEVERFEKKICVVCPTMIALDSFSNALSLKEYKISGMCQACQDSIFEA